MCRLNLHATQSLAGMTIAVVVVFFGEARTTAADLEVGTAQTVITPILNSPMAGYYFDRMAEGVHDDLMAKAILFSRGDESVGLVACDLINLPGAVVDRAKSLIAERNGIPRENVIISATHAHTGPRHGPEYDDWLVEKIADAVHMAASNAAPAQLAFGVGEEDRLPYHRRFWMKDGSLQTNPGKLNPDIVRPAGGIDPAVPVLTVTQPDGSPLAVMVNYALHLDTTGGTLISADFPQVVASVLARTMNPEMITLHTTGACGNINHWDVQSEDPQRSFAEAERIGTILAGEVLKVTKMSEPVAVDRLAGAMQDVDLPLKSFTEEELAKAREIVKVPNPPDVDFVLERVWALRALEVAKREGTTITAPVQAICVGDMALVAVPCELFYELGLDIKRQSPFAHTVVVTLANGNIGYVPRKEDYDNGGYEVVSSRLAPGGGETLVQAALDVLEQLKQRK